MFHMDVRTYTVIQIPGDKTLRDRQTDRLCQVERQTEITAI